jgi:copper homeostasis protein
VTHPLLEVIVQTLEDARAAARGGADRLEVVRAIEDGGLTPPVALVESIAREVALPLRVMIRANAGFDSTAAERSALRAAARDLAATGVDGLVVGFARDGEPVLDDLSDVLRDTPGVPVTFHRAFDVLRDPLAAVDRIAAIPQVDRILTSGGDGSCAARADRLRALTLRGAGRLRIIAGGGMTEELIARVIRTQAAGEIHVGRAARESNDPAAPVSAACVARVRQLLDHRGTPLH